MSSSPIRIHSLEPIAGLASGHPLLHKCKSSSPIRTHSLGPIAGLASGHLSLHKRKSSSPSKFLPLGPIAELRGVRRLPPQGTPHQNGTTTRSSGPISGLLNGRLRRQCGPETTRVVIIFLAANSQSSPLDQRTKPLLYILSFDRENNPCRGCGIGG